MRAHLVRVLRAAVAAVAAMLCSVAPAQAAVYDGAWDPLYGIPFSGTGSLVGFNLGWSGEVQVYVPDSCALGVGTRNYGFGSSCAQSSYVQSAVVDFYDNATPAVTKGTVAFNTSSMSILALHFVGNQLMSLATLPSSWDRVSWNSPAPSSSPYFSLLFADPDLSSILRFLGFGSEIPANYYGPLLLSHPSTDFDNLHIDSLRDILEALMEISEISVSNVSTPEGRPTYPGGALFSLSAPAPSIPEPGSLVLVSLALLASGWVARSRRQR